jgi:amphi-Trp domain-containing protein
MATDEFKHESLQDSKSIGQYLRALIEGIEAGRVDLSDDNGEVVLHPTGLVGFELRAKRRGNHSKLQLKLTWTEELPTTGGGSLRVHSEPR